MGRLSVKYPSKKVEDPNLGSSGPNLVCSGPNLGSSDPYLVCSGSNLVCSDSNLSSSDPSLPCSTETSSVIRTFFLSFPSSIGNTRNNAGFTNRAFRSNVDNRFSFTIHQITRSWQRKRQSPSRGISAPSRHRRRGRIPQPRSRGRRPFPSRRISGHRRRSEHCPIGQALIKRLYSEIRVEPLDYWSLYLESFQAEWPSRSFRRMGDIAKADCDNSPSASLSDFRINDLILIPCIFPPPPRYEDRTCEMNKNPPGSLFSSLLKPPATSDAPTSHSLNSRLR